MANLQIIDVALLRVNEFIAPVIHLMQVKDYSLHPHILKSMRKVRTQMLSDRMLICTNQFQQHLISFMRHGSSILRVYRTAKVTALRNPEFDKQTFFWMHCAAVVYFINSRKILPRPRNHCDEQEPDEPSTRLHAQRR